MIDLGLYDWGFGKNRSKISKFREKTRNFEQKSLKKRSQRRSGFRYRLLVDFGLILGGFWETKSIKNHQKNDRQIDVEKNDDRRGAKSEKGSPTIIGAIDFGRRGGSTLIGGYTHPYGQTPGPQPVPTSLFDLQR